MSEEALQIAEKRREAQGKGEKERYTYLNAKFQRIARKDKKAFFSDKCKEIEENNRMKKTRELFKKIRDTKVKVKSLSLVQLFVTPFIDCKPTTLLHPQDFSGKSTGVGCRFLFQRIFLTQGLNPGLQHCRQTLLPSEPPGKSRALLT